MITFTVIIKYICKEIKKEDYDDLSDYNYYVSKLFIKQIMDKIIEKLSSMKMNENINNFLLEYEQENHEKNLS